MAIIQRVRATQIYTGSDAVTRDARLMLSTEAVRTNSWLSRCDGTKHRLSSDEHRPLHGLRPSSVRP